MAFRVIGANNRRTRITIELPFDENGDWAFDEDGDPIKGRTPVVITLPRFDFVPIDDFKAMQDTLKTLEERDDLDNQAKGREVVLAMLAPFVTDVQHELLTGRALGELEQISVEWARQSATPVGESPASNGSSTNTRRRSNTTSSAPASASAT